MPDPTPTPAPAPTPAPKHDRSRINQEWIDDLNYAAQVVATAQKAAYAPAMTKGEITADKLGALATDIKNAQQLASQAVQQTTGKQIITGTEEDLKTALMEAIKKCRSAPSKNTKPRTPACSRTTPSATNGTTAAPSSNKPPPTSSPNWRRTRSPPSTPPRSARCKRRWTITKKSRPTNPAANPTPRHPARNCKKRPTTSPRAVARFNCAPTPNGRTATKATREFAPSSSCRRTASSNKATFQFYNFLALREAGETAS